MFKTKKTNKGYLLGAISLGIAGAVAALMVPKSRTYAKKLGAQTTTWAGTVSEGLKNWTKPKKESHYTPVLFGSIIGGTIVAAVASLFLSSKPNALLLDLSKKYGQISKNSHPGLSKTVAHKPSVKKRKPLLKAHHN